jgi:meso-butanediol dehydrogenase/(S,S)-butanediol dehydrogenase/diacetyl reductase
MTASFSPVAVVTGGARGIGLAVAPWFLTHGHRVALRDIDAATLRATEAALDDPSRVLAIPCDVSQPAQVTVATEQTESYFGRIDALVNNARPQRPEAPARQVAGKTRLRRSDS